jgi:hypothetical protein
VSTGDASGGGNWDYYMVRKTGERMYVIIHRPHGITDEDREYYAEVFEEAFINRAAATGYVLTTNAASSHNAHSVRSTAQEPDNTGVFVTAGVILLLLIVLFVSYLFYAV